MVMRVFICAAALAALSVSTTVLPDFVVENITTDVFNVTQLPSGIEEPELEFLDLRRHPPLPLRGSRLQMPCSCGDLTCGCCVGMRIQTLGFDRNACMNLTYEPYDFAIEANFLMNEESFFRRSISAKNPPPLCMPVPVPVLPTMDLCLRIFEVYTPGANLHACLDMEARLLRAPLVVLHFDCMVMGRDGVSLVKPGEFELPVEPADPQQGPDPGGDDFYDEVTEDRARVNKTSFTTTTTDSSTTVEASTAKPEPEPSSAPPVDVTATSSTEAVHTTTTSDLN